MRALIVPIALVAVMAIAGCGPGGPAATGPSGPTAAPATAGPTSTPAIGVDPTATAGTATPGQAALPDPCALITEGEANAAVLGPVAVSPGVEEGVGTPDLGTGRQCAWNAGREAQARVTVFPNPGELYDVYKLQQSQFGEIKELTGTGDKAFTVGNYDCNVVLGDVIMVVTLAPGDSYATDPEPRMVDLCKAAAARL